MCGIIGWLGHGEEFRSHGENALRLLVHRGPDASYLWISEHGDAALGSQRLAILDLRHAADQPMARGRHRLVHNGEIYNFVELRAELRQVGYTFTTSSDTEVIIAAYDRFGAAAVERFNGMFAIALWDAKAGELFLARDRFGEKPLYFGRGQACFHFASEIKALLTIPCLPRQPNVSVLYRYLATGYVPDGEGATFFRGIEQLRPATWLRLKADQSTDEHRYWRLAPDRSVADLRPAAAAETLSALLNDSVRIRLRSDVPIGTSLSGGIDSSLIALAISGQLRSLGAGHRQRTFSARHKARRIDEGPFIKAVVTKIGADAREVWIDPHDLPIAIEQLVWHQDEPFPHTSMFAQWKVYELARRSGVTVVLDGQGADEIFAGYPALAYGAAWLDRLVRLDLIGLAREIRAYRRLTRMPLSTAARFLLGRATPRPLRGAARIARWRSFGIARKGGASAFSETRCGECSGAVDRLHEGLCEALLRSSLPGLVRFADRSSMAHSIEVRLPFLDHRVAAFGLGLSSDLLVSDGWTKRILRHALRDDLPEIADRPEKIGFATPELEWFRGPLRPWAESVLVDAARRELYGRYEVERMWRAVLAGRTPSDIAWRVVNVELWMRRFLDAAHVVAPEPAGMPR